MATETDPDPVASGRRIGVFGGTFDPPHIGHVAVARDVADRLGLDRVLWIPAGAPPHKPAGAGASAAARLRMVERAVTADPRFVACAIETERAGPSYTSDTLRGLRGELGAVELFLILGVDQYRALDSWHEPDAILRQATLAVMDRGGESAHDVSAPDAVTRAEASDRDRVRSGGVLFVPVRRVDVSSTDVRARVAGEEPFGHLVPEGVGAIIDEEHLYRD